MSKYCIYLDSITKDFNYEHIIPLSLGGCDDFVIEVDRGFNSSVGSSIDGDVANDFLVLFERDRFKAKGHSKKHEKPLIKNVRLKDGRPAQAIFGQEGLRIFDLQRKRPLPLTDSAGGEIKCNFKMEMGIDLFFVAKVALAAGYFAYGEAFKSYVKHSELRKIITADKISLPPNIKAKFYDRFFETTDDIEFMIVKMATEIGGCSSVLILPSENSFGVAVGVLGKFMGFIIVPSQSKHLPNSDDYRLGHCMFIQDGKLKRFSFDYLRQRLLTKFDEKL
ncbi:hypothetical protein COW36_21155 [bacterium (Candidatus Blackallbacteria) CG17_big_fil_post_rev_8_21_14_2_50_48_46]|uniref:HNH endonuclease 5 domain-containing protein n=1 Tax=bacterium (Candidatus Blackallbacteria) CG17_big_fil_post_rev_8_21_14_2_50_48_46 TaxID=2014261 RepID=A0A2M7G042_9BACT|nr:MAG: hypothetical protein COW64_14465 [bacterium (Candidatus Blackallbacteria) CG18_big_fil_WC_8_21_14_2_50_49_26]PIW14549.1 MAG: hypothetical protein COW36_21155 [bacterium (Candidatus Blackallbacteria) CG17_big_fil_post_rev_8_21_14_2_50_48_46]PIW47234.1 MAG: hypothetical protein COW20_13600 [bacterium (Candidatus Blackallbacteria) CG13_big_fil_rev_8_21_14_2_50_49_14]